MDVITEVKELLEQSKEFHPVLKDFQSDIEVKQEDDLSCPDIEVLSVESTNPAVSSVHSLLIKKVRDPNLKDTLSSQFLAGVYIESTCTGHTDIPLHLGTDYLITERCAGYRVLLEEVRESRVDKVAIQQLAMVLGRLHKSSAIPENISSAIENNRTIEDLEKVLFRQPYSDETSKAAQLLTNPDIRAAIDHLTRILKEKKESFVHGNLSVQNVTVKKGHPKIENLDKSFIGPRAVDVGMLLASYMTLYHLHMLTPENNDAHRQVSYKMMDACTTTVNTYLEEMKSVLSEEAVRIILSEIAGYAACELIRRSSNSDPYPGLGNNVAVQTEMFESGVRLIRKYDSITDIGRLMMIGLALC